MQVSRNRPLGGPTRTSRRISLAALAAALVLATLALAGYFTLGQAPAVSAQTVLRRAVAGSLAPNQAVHRLYDIRTPAGALQGTAEGWLLMDATGATAQSAQTYTWRGPDGATQRVQRTVITGQAAQEYDYNAQDNTVRVTTGTVAQMFDDAPNIFDGTSVATFLSKVAQGQQSNVRLLPQQSVDGRAVYVVQVVNQGQPYLTVYFDTATYVMRRVDIAGPEAAEGRLTLDATLPPAALPPDAFLFAVPAGARVVQSQTLDNLDMLRTLVAACHLTNEALKAAQQAGGQTPLAICRGGTPAMSQTQLVAALVAAHKPPLDASVAAGTLTPAQEAEQVSNLQAQFNAWVTTPLGP